MTAYSNARYRFGPTELAPSVPRAPDAGPIAAMVERARDSSVSRDGVILREARLRFQFVASHCAVGWGVSEVELGELERGVRRFVTTDDLKAALDQLWLWHSEERHAGRATVTGGTWDGTTRT